MIEIDAASHGGVDDARDLREKAFFAPVRSKYKVYIVDEAHMVTTQGFNALLKLVEEPPPHLRFIFATTEPEKVLPTIRSRTHHYPFRLIPPRLLSAYLSELCEKEDVAIEAAALPLVVRAGAGSARDSLSVLDQLIGGAGPDGVTYQLAAGLLGYTPDALLDDVIEAFAAGDGASVFAVVDRVIETGQDPRRFAEDLLRRLRDLVIITAVPDAPATGLIDVAEDAGERLVAQAARFGAAELSRAADLVATGLTEMRGATAPRLLLELICARVLLPGADHGSDGVMARLDRLERRVAIGGPVSGTTPAPAPAPVVDADPDPRARSRRPTPEPTPEPTPGADRRGRRPSRRPSPRQPEPAARAAPAAAPAGGLSLVDVRRLWPDIVEAVKARRRLDLDPPHPARPGGRRRRHHAHPRLQQRRGAGVLRRRRQRRDRPAGRHRRGRRPTGRSRRIVDPGRAAVRDPVAGHAGASAGAHRGRRAADRGRAGPEPARPDDRPLRRRGRPRGDPADPSPRATTPPTTRAPRPTPRPIPTTMTSTPPVSPAPSCSSSSSAPR